MPVFPNSGYSANQSSGVFVRAQGSHSPMVEPDFPQADEIQHPFKVTAFHDGNDVKARIRAGTVNNLVPTIGGDPLDDDPAPTLTLTDDETNRIYLKASTASPPVFFPDTIVAEAQTSDETDTDSDGYLLLATVVVADGRIVSVNQFVYASQVLVRAKPGTDPALWSWSSR